MHVGKSAKLPKHPNWTLDPASRPEDGRLTLRYGSNELHIRLWPRASAWLRRSSTSRWQEGAAHTGRLLRACRNEPCPKAIYLYRKKHLVEAKGQFLFDFIRDVLPESAVSETDHALRQALQTIPEAVRESLSQLHRCEWPALQITSRLRAAAELLPSHPQLFWLWLRRYRLAPQTNPGLTALFCLQFDLQFPRRIQLSKLGFANGKTWLRILAKAPVRHLHRIDWEALAEASRSGIDPALLKRLRHHPGPVPVALLQTLADANTRRWLSPALLRTSLENPRYDIHQLLNIYDQFQRVYPALGGTFKLPAQIDDLEWERRSMERNLAEYAENRHRRKTSPFTCPEGWTHLDRIEALTDEGIRQRNCLRENPGGILSGSGHVYRIEHPVRATLHVDTSPEGYWWVRECRGPRNSDIPAAVERDLLYTLLGRKMPDLKDVERSDYPASPTPSNPLYQRITNSRALWALHKDGRIPFLPEVLEGPLQRGERAIYQIRRPRPYVIEMRWTADFGWDLGRLLHIGVKEPSPIPFMVATHMLWEHQADLHAHGFPVPAWDAPRIDSLTDYQPVDNIWKLLRFRWATGTCISVDDIQKGKAHPFYCRIGNRQLAVIAENAAGDWSHLRYFACGGDDLCRLSPEAEAIEDALGEVLDDLPVPQRFYRTDAAAFEAAPKLPRLREMDAWLRPAYREVRFPE